MRFPQRLIALLLAGSFVVDPSLASAAVAPVAPHSARLLEVFRSNALNGREYADRPFRTAFPAWRRLTAGLSRLAVAGRRALPTLRIHASWTWDHRQEAASIVFLGYAVASTVAYLLGFEIPGSGATVLTSSVLGTGQLLCTRPKRAEFQTLTEQLRRLLLDLPPGLPSEAADLPDEWRMDIIASTDQVDAQALHRLRETIQRFLSAQTTRDGRTGVVPQIFFVRPPSGHRLFHVTGHGASLVHFDVDKQAIFLPVWAAEDFMEATGDYEQPMVQLAYHAWRHLTDPTGGSARWQCHGGLPIEQELLEKLLPTLDSLGAVSKKDQDAIMKLTDGVALLPNRREAWLEKSFQAIPRPGQGPSKGWVEDEAYKISRQWAQAHSLPVPDGPTHPANLGWHLRLTYYPFEWGRDAFNSRIRWGFNWVHYPTKRRIEMGPVDVRNFGYLTASQVKEWQTSYFARAQDANANEPYATTVLTFLRQPAILEAMLATEAYDSKTHARERAALMALARIAIAQNPASSLILVKQRVVYTFGEGGSLRITRSDIDLAIDILRSLAEAKAIDLGERKIIPTWLQILSSRAAVAQRQMQQGNRRGWEHLAAAWSAAVEQLEVVIRRTASYARSFGILQSRWRRHGKPLSEVRRFASAASGPDIGPRVLSRIQDSLARRGISLVGRDFIALDAVMPMLRIGRAHVRKGIDATVGEDPDVAHPMPVRHVQADINGGIPLRDASIDFMDAGLLGNLGDGSVAYANGIAPVTLDRRLHFLIELNRIVAQGGYLHLSVRRKLPKEIRKAFSRVGFTVLTEPNPRLRFSRSTLARLAKGDGDRMDRIRARLSGASYLVAVRTHQLTAEEIAALAADSALVETLRGFSELVKASEQEREIEHQPVDVRLDDLEFTGLSTDEFEPTSITRDEMASDERYRNFEDYLACLVWAAQPNNPYRSLTDHEVNHLFDFIELWDDFSEENLPRADVEWVITRVMREARKPGTRLTPTQSGGGEREPENDKDEDENEGPEDQTPPAPKGPTLWDRFLEAMARTPGLLDAVRPQRHGPLGEPAGPRVDPAVEAAKRRAEQIEKVILELRKINRTPRFNANINPPLIEHFIAARGDRHIIGGLLNANKLGVSPDQVIAALKRHGLYVAPEKSGNGSKPEGLDEATVEITARFIGSMLQLGVFNVRDWPLIRQRLSERLPNTSFELADTAAKLAQEVPLGQDHRADRVEALLDFLKTLHDTVLGPAGYVIFQDERALAQFVSVDANRSEAYQVVLPSDSEPAGPLGPEVIWVRPLREANVKTRIVRHAGILLERLVASDVEKTLTERLVELDRLQASGDPVTQALARAARSLLIRTHSAQPNGVRSIATIQDEWRRSGLAALAVEAEGRRLFKHASNEQRKELVARVPFDRELKEVAFLRSHLRASSPFWDLLARPQAFPITFGEDMSGSIVASHAVAMALSNLDCLRTMDAPGEALRKLIRPEGLDVGDNNGMVVLWILATHLRVPGTPQLHELQVSHTGLWMAETGERLDTLLASKGLEAFRREVAAAQATHSNVWVEFREGRVVALVPSEIPAASATSVLAASDIADLLRSILAPGPFSLINNEWVTRVAQAVTATSQRELWGTFPAPLSRWTLERLLYAFAGGAYPDGQNLTAEQLERLSQTLLPILSPMATGPLPADAREALMDALESTFGEPVPASVRTALEIPDVDFFLTLHQDFLFPLGWVIDPANIAAVEPKERLLFHRLQSMPERITFSDPAFERPVSVVGLRAGPTTTSLYASPYVGIVFVPSQEVSTAKERADFTRQRLVPAVNASRGKPDAGTTRIKYFSQVLAWTSRAHQNVQDVKASAEERFAAIRESLAGMVLATVLGQAALTKRKEAFPDTATPQDRYRLAFAEAYAREPNDPLISLLNAKVGDGPAEALSRQSALYYLFGDLTGMSLSERPSLLLLNWIDDVLLPAADRARVNSNLRALVLFSALGKYLRLGTDEEIDQKVLDPERLPSLVSDISRALLDRAAEGGEQALRDVASAVIADRYTVRVIKEGKNAYRMERLAAKTTTAGTATTLQAKGLTLEEYVSQLSSWLPDVLTRGWMTPREWDRLQATLETMFGKPLGDSLAALGRRAGQYHALSDESFAALDRFFRQLNVEYLKPMGYALLPESASSIGGRGIVSLLRREAAPQVWRVVGHEIVFPQVRGELIQGDVSRSAFLSSRYFGIAENFPKLIGIAKAASAWMKVARAQTSPTEISRERNPTRRLRLEAGAEVLAWTEELLAKYPTPLEFAEATSAETFPQIRYFHVAGRLGEELLKKEPRALLIGGRDRWDDIPPLDRGFVAFALKYVNAFDFNLAAIEAAYGSDPAAFGRAVAELATSRANFFGILCTAEESPVEVTVYRLFETLERFYSDGSSGIAAGELEYFISLASHLLPPSSFTELKAEETRAKVLIQLSRALRERAKDMEGLKALLKEVMRERFKVHVRTAAPGQMIVEPTAEESPVQTVGEPVGTGRPESVADLEAWKAELDDVLGLMIRSGRASAFLVKKFVKGLEGRFGEMPQELKDQGLAITSFKTRSTESLLALARWVERVNVEYLRPAGFMVAPALSQAGALEIWKPGEVEGTVQIQGRERPVLIIAASRFVAEPEQGDVPVAINPFAGIFKSSTEPLERLVQKVSASASQEKGGQAFRSLLGVLKEGGFESPEAQVHQLRRLSDEMLAASAVFQQTPAGQPGLLKEKLGALDIPDAEVPLTLWFLGDHILEMIREQPPQDDLKQEFFPWIQAEWVALIAANSLCLSPAARKRVADVVLELMQQTADDGKVPSSHVPFVVRLAHEVFGLPIERIRDILGRPEEANNLFLALANVIAETDDQTWRDVADRMIRRYYRERIIRHSDGSFGVAPVANPLDAPPEPLTTLSVASSPGSNDAWIEIVENAFSQAIDYATVPAPTVLREVERAVERRFGAWPPAVEGRFAALLWVHTQPKERRDALAVPAISEFFEALNHYVLEPNGYVADPDAGGAGRLLSSALVYRLTRPAKVVRWENGEPALQQFVGNLANPKNEEDDAFKAQILHTNYLSGIVELESHVERYIAHQQTGIEKLRRRIAALKSARRSPDGARSLQMAELLENWHRYAFQEVQKKPAAFRAAYERTTWPSEVAKYVVQHLGYQQMLNGKPIIGFGKAARMSEAFMMEYSPGFRDSLADMTEPGQQLSLALNYEFLFTALHMLIAEPVKGMSLNLNHNLLRRLGVEAQGDPSDTVFWAVLAVELLHLSPEDVRKRQSDPALYGDLIVQIGKRARSMNPGALSNTARRILRLHFTIEIQILPNGDIRLVQTSGAPFTPRRLPYLPSLGALALIAGFLWPSAQDSLGAPLNVQNLLGGPALLWMGVVPWIAGSLIAWLRPHWLASWSSKGPNANRLRHFVSRRQRAAA